ncbi:MAG: hypothetical protein CL521_01575 [Actinobacteria bacterium]|nr:hypothetical protein [Actinomycetota bacterium]
MQALSRSVSRIGSVLPRRDMGAMTVDDQLRGVLRKGFSPDTVNVSVVGAGAMGLWVANKFKAFNPNIVSRSASQFNVNGQPLRLPVYSGLDALPFSTQHFHVLHVCTLLHELPDLASQLSRHGWDRPNVLTVLVANGWRPEQAMCDGARKGPLARFIARVGVTSGASFGAQRSVDIRFEKHNQLTLVPESMGRFRYLHKQIADQYVDYLTNQGVQCDLIDYDQASDQSRDKAINNVQNLVCVIEALRRWSCVDVETNPSKFAYNEGLGLEYSLKLTQLLVTEILRLTDQVSRVDGALLSQKVAMSLAYAESDHVSSTNQGLASNRVVEDLAQQWVDLAINTDQEAPVFHQQISELIQSWNQVASSSTLSERLVHSGAVSECLSDIFGRLTHEGSSGMTSC